MNIAFVPVRGGSKSIPLKNIKELCGKPLVFWVLSALENSEKIDIIYVATDSEKIKKVVESFNMSKIKIYDRNPENAQDTSSTESVMIEFINKNNFKDNDLFILVQATSPLTKPEDFNNAIEKFKKEKADSLLTGVRTKRFFWNENDTPVNYDYKNRPRRQDFKGLIMENGAFYISTISNIKKNPLHRLSGKIIIHKMDEYTGIEIDEPNDWLMVEKLLQKYVLPNKKTSIKLFLSDIDGTLTDGGMYYDVNGNELKKFSTIDGKGFEMLKKKGIKTGLITGENTKIAENRAKKLKVDYLFQGLNHEEKLNTIKELCKKENISLQEVAYIGDDINCKELLECVGIAGCPNNAHNEIKNMPNILCVSKNGGLGAVREFIEKILY